MEPEKNEDFQVLASLLEYQFSEFWVWVFGYVVSITGGRMLYFRLSAIIAVEAARLIFSHGQTMPQRDVDQEKLEWQF